MKNEDRKGAEEKRGSGDLIRNLLFTFSPLLLCGLWCGLLSAQQGLRSPAFVAKLHPNGPSYSCDTVNDANLKGYWKLDEASGNATDSKGANTLTDNGGVTSGIGKISTARTFTAATPSYFSIADNAALSSGDIDITVGAWVYYGGTLVAGAYPGIIGKFVTGQQEYQLYLNGDNQRYQFAVSSNGTAQVDVKADSFGDPSDGVYHLVIAWHDATANTINIQIDGGTVDSVSYGTGLFDGTGEFNIGSIGGAAFSWTGQIDEAFVIKRVLTTSERLGLYQFGSGCRPSGL